MRAAAQDAGSGLSPRLRASITGASDYLDRAPAVVAVVKDLPVPPAPSGRPEPDLPLLTAIGEEFGITNSVKRYLQAIASDL